LAFPNPIADDVAIGIARVGPTAAASRMIAAAAILADIRMTLTSHLQL
jgi:hypothetical protein